MDESNTQPISIIMGSDSDWSVMQKTAEALEIFQIKYTVEVISAHRTPQKLVDFSTQACARGVRVIIAGAGGAAHLPGMVASMTVLPVIGVPVALAKLDGLDSLLSIVQMPAGIPVATMAVDGAFNAGLFAIRILALTDNNLQKQLENYQSTLAESVEKKNHALQDQITQKRCGYNELM